MKNSIRYDTDLAIFLLEEDLERLERGSTLKNIILYGKAGEEIEIPLKLAENKKGDFLSVRPFIKEFSKSEFIEVYLGKSNLENLKNGTGFVNRGDVYVYSHRYKFFSTLFKHADNSKKQHNNTY